MGLILGLWPIFFRFARRKFFHICGKNQAIIGHKIDYFLAVIGNIHTFHTTTHSRGDESSPRGAMPKVADFSYTDFLEFINVVKGIISRIKRLTRVVKGLNSQIESCQRYHNLVKGLVWRLKSGQSCHFTRDDHLIQRSSNRFKREDEFRHGL